MLKLLKLKATNFVHYENLEIDFRHLEDNLLFITGENRDVAGSSSNGSGKSQIGDILTDLLFDKTIRGHSPKSFIGKFGKFSKRSLTILNEETKEIFSIRKYQNHPDYGDRVYFMVKRNGKKRTLHRKKKADTYREIWRVLGINWNTFKNRNFFGQDDDERFLSVTDVKKAKIISDIQDLNDLQKCKDESHKEFSKSNKEKKKVEIGIEKVESNISLVQSSIKELWKKIKKDIKNEKKHKKNLKKELTAARDKLKYAKGEVAGIEEIRESLSTLKSQLEQIDETIETLNHIKQEVNKISLGISDAAKERDNKSTDILERKRQ